MSQAVPARIEILFEDTWDIASIFPTVEDWEAAIANAPAEIQALARFQGHLGVGSVTVADWMEQLESVLRLVGRIFLYASLEYSVDMNDQEAIARYDRARSLRAQALAKTAFAEPELLAIGLEQLQRWTSAEPRLAHFGHYFDRLYRRQAHVRSPEVETLLKQLLDAFNAASTTHRILADADLSFVAAQSAGAEPVSVDIAQSNIGALITHEDRDMRRTAWQNYADAYLDYKNTFANCLAAGVKQHVYLARARNYNTSLEAALKPNDIPTQVFHNTLAIVRKNLPIWHRYWRVRREALGYETLNVYDIKAPLTAGKPSVPFDQASDWICAGMAPLGESYVSAMRHGLDEERWVDKYPNKGKRSGAFSSGVPGTHPFIFMSYTDDLFSLSTLAHELGHSMHSFLTWQNQPYVYGRYSLFVAEVASNFNQALVRAHLLDTNDDPQFQIALLEEAMSNFHRYFFIMPALARFELETHERVERGEALTADVLIDLMAAIFKEGYGDHVAFDRDRIGITWAQFPTHMYANFYVYQYTTGIAAAHALARRVLSGQPGAKEKYLSFLKAGGSLYPLDALKLAGVDMTSSEPLEEAFAVLASYVDRLQQLTA